MYHIEIWQENNLGWSPMKTDVYCIVLSCDPTLVAFHSLQECSIILMKTFVHIALKHIISIVHDLFSKLNKFCTTQRFAKEITYHLISGTPDHHNLFVINFLLNKEISHIKVFCPPGGAQNSILFQHDGTLIIL